MNKKSKITTSAISSFLIVLHFLMHDLGEVELVRCDLGMTF